MGGLAVAPRGPVRPSTQTHPLRTPGAPGPASLVWALSSSKAASWPIRVRFDLISYKVSQNGNVSPESVEKAYVSPYITKRVRKVTSWISQISRFPSLLSQGINGPYLTVHGTLLSKRRSVDGCAHPCTRETDGQIPPRTTAASCFWWSAPHLTQREHLTVFSTDPFLEVLQEIMTETVILGTSSSEACGRSILRSILS